MLVYSKVVGIEIIVIDDIDFVGIDIKITVAEATGIDFVGIVYKILLKITILENQII